MLELPNEYDYFAKNRKHFSKKSGGIVVIFKKKLQKYLRFIKSESEFVQWIDISKDISPFGQNILLGCTYIPPEFSKYASDDSFIDIEE